MLGAIIGFLLNVKGTEMYRNQGSIEELMMPLTSSTGRIKQTRLDCIGFVRLYLYERWDDTC